MLECFTVESSFLLNAAFDSANASVELDAGLELLASFRFGVPHSHHIPTL